MLYPGPPIQDDAVQQRCVPLGVRNHFIGRGEHDLSKAPDPRCRRTWWSAPPLSEALNQLGGRHGWRAMLDFQESAALAAAGPGIGLDYLVLAGDAALPARWTLGLEFHLLSASGWMTRAPSRSISATRT